MNTRKLKKNIPQEIEEKGKETCLLRLPHWLNDWIKGMTGNGPDKFESRQDAIIKILRDAHGQAQVNEQQI